MKPIFVVLLVVGHLSSNLAFADSCSNGGAPVGSGGFNEDVRAGIERASEEETLAISQATYGSSSQNVALFDDYESRERTNWPSEFSYDE